MGLTTFSSLAQTKCSSIGESGSQTHSGAQTRTCDNNKDKIIYMEQGCDLQQESRVAGGAIWHTLVATLLSIFPRTAVATHVTYHHQMWRE